MTSTAPMGGPLSEAERIAEIRARLDTLDAKIKLRAENAKRGIVTPLGSAADRLHQYAPMDLEYLLERVGVLEGQLATARRLLDEQRGATRVAAGAADRFRDVLSEALGHADLDHADLLEIATAAVGRLLEEIARLCRRCEGTGAVHVALYGGHTVDCGLCHGTGRITSTERTNPS